MDTSKAQSRWFIPVLFALTLGVFPMVASAQLEDQGAWIDNITQTVAATDVTEGSLQPYLGQLQIVRAAFRFGDDHSVATAMNRFMDMLELQEDGITAETANWLLDYCYRTIPAKYHDASRHQQYRDHMDRVNGENGFGAEGG